MMMSRKEAAEKLQQAAAIVQGVLDRGIAEDDGTNALDNCSPTQLEWPIETLTSLAAQLER